jgi:carboxyl-terminal processing protease
MKRGSSIWIALVLVLSSLLYGFLGTSTTATSQSPLATTDKFLAGFTESLDAIQRNYVEKVDPEALVYSAIKNMLHGLDPHSSFFDPKEFARIREEQHSRFFGVGIHIRPLAQSRGRIAIIAPPEPGTPAEKSGLRAGDIITRINGEPTDDWTLDDVINHLRGPRRSTVELTVDRAGVAEPLQFKVARDEVPLKAISYSFEIKPGIGYIKMDRFSESSAQELRQKLQDLGMDNLAGLILDLRDNPGGLLNQAIEVTDFFVPSGDVIVSTRGRAVSGEHQYRAPGRRKLQVPLVVLINRRSASASEIVAGALQDHDRALIVGETSFGKGLVQTVYSLENDTGLALTTARYYTPSGRLIQRNYSNSTFEYYYMNPDDAAGLAASSGNREIRHTDNGRIVYGGGGVTPDVVEHVGELNRFEALLASKDSFFQFVRNRNSGVEPPVAINPSSSARPADFKVTENVLADFEQFLREQHVECTHEDVKRNLEYVTRGIQQYVANAASGLQEGYRIQVRGDAVILKALEVMPEAKALMASGKASPAARESAN